MTDEQAFSQSIAVVIGINRYRADIPALASAVNDASRLAVTLQQDHGYRPMLLLDEQASLAGLLHLVEKTLPAEVGSNDRVLFYFAGHGVATSGDDGPQGFLLPQDARRGDSASFLDMARLHEALMALPCRHMLVILDSCFSGAFRWSARRDATLGLPTVYQERFDRFLQDPAWQLITSAAHDQTAADQWRSDDFGGRSESDAHSPFAQALLSGLEGAADLVPKDGDGVVTATELYLYIEDRLQPKSQQFGTRQTPGLWPLRKHDKGEFIFLVPGRERCLPPAPILTGDNNPYRGLAAFETRHADVFFGREPVINDLVEKIRGRSLSVVLGASGTGKSSLVKAGAVPRFAQEHDWQILPLMRPGSDPLRALQTALGSEAGDTPAITNAAALTRRLSTTDTPLLLVIDQFEELLTMTRSAQQRAMFLDQLAALLEQADGRLHLVLTLRSDFEALFDHSPLAALWQAGRFVVPPMSRADLRAAIEGPALERVLYFEPSSLVEQLVDEVAAMPGGLPLLSFTLSEMYRRYIARASDDRCLTQDDYDALGGVVGALRSRADAELAALDAAQQSTLRRLMLRMLRVQHGALVRQRVSESQLLNTDPQETARLQEVLTRLVTARLVVRGVDEQGQAFVEPAHDALVSSWGQLLQWTHEAQDQEPDLAFLHALQRNAEEWSKARPADRSGLLWRDKLRSRRLWTLRRKEPTQLSQTEDRFCKASIARWRFLRNSAIGLIIALALFGLLAAALGLIALERQEQADQRRIEAEQQTRLAQANALTAAARGALDGEGDATLGFKLAAAALALEPDHQPALWLLRKALYSSGFIIDRGAIISTPFARRLGADVGEAFWSPDGRHIALWRYNEDEPDVGELSVVTADGQLRSRITVRDYGVAQFDSSGRYLLWPERLALDLDARQVSAAMLATLEPWTHGGSELAYESYNTVWYRAASDDLRVRAGLLRDISTAEEFMPVLDFSVLKDGEPIEARCIDCNQVALRADGTMMATADLDGRIALWKFVAGWEQALQFATLRRVSRGATVHVLAFSPDGSKLLALDRLGDAWLWDIGWFTVDGAASRTDSATPTVADASRIDIELDDSGLGNDTPTANLMVTERASGRQWRRSFVTSTVVAGLRDDIITLIDDVHVWLMDASGAQALSLPLDPEIRTWSPDEVGSTKPLGRLIDSYGEQVSLKVPLAAESIIGMARDRGFLAISADDQQRWDVVDAITAQTGLALLAPDDSAWAALQRRLGLGADGEAPPPETPSIEPATMLPLPALWQTVLERTPEPAEPMDPDIGLQPIRTVAADWRDAGLLSALQTMAPPLFYLGGPHEGGQWNLASESFGHYNPEFLFWLSDNLLPASRDEPLRLATQSAYDRHVLRLARLLAITRHALDDQPALRDAVLAEYSSRQTDRGNYLLDALRPLADAIGPVDEGEPDDVVQFAGFWIRRILDGSAPVFEDLLRQALDAYDPVFAATLDADRGSPAEDE